MKFDVVKAENEYVTTNISYRKLAEKYKVSYTIISKYGVERKWTQKRKEFKSKVSQRFIEKAAKTETDKLSKLIETTDKAIEAVSKNIDGYLRVAEDGVSIPMGELRPAVSALKDLVVIQRDLNGILSLKDKQTIDIARERLAIEQSKANVGDNDDSETGIVVLPALVPDVDDEEIVKEGETNA